MLPFEGLANESVLAVILQVSLLIYFVAYFLIALRRVYATTSLGTAARAFAILFAYMIVVSGLIEATSSFLLISD